MHKHTPHTPKKPAWFAARINDVELLGKLDTCLALKPAERQFVTATMARFVERGSLLKGERDRALGIARAHKLFAATESKPAKKTASPGVDHMDMYSVRPGKIDPRVAAQVPALGGSMPVPPIRRAM